MKNLRKVVALVLAFAMVLSMSAVSFAADMTAAEKAETLGLLQGEGAGVTAEYLAKTPTRIQALIVSLRLRGLEDEAKAYEGTEMFSDQEDITWAEGKAIAAYAKANPELGWIGTDGALLPNEPITAQAYVKVMLEALGYVQDVDFAWADVFTFASSVGLMDLTADSVMTNESLAIGSVEALAATTKAGTVLVDDLIASGAIAQADAEAAGLVVVDADFAVVSVETFGLKAFIITFASDIDDDETTLVDVENSDDDAVSVESYTVDGSMLTVVLDDVQAQATELDLLISATGLDAIELDEEVATVTLVDKADPELISVTVENAKTFVVKYSEPINEASYENGTAVFDNVKLDDAKLVGKVVASDDWTELTYTLNSAVAANTYVFTMEAVEDFAGFVAPSEAVTVTVIADDAAPQLVSAIAKDLDTVELTFDENVADIGTVTINGTNYTIPSSKIVDKVVTVELNADLEASDAFVAVKGEYDEVEDVIGNKSGDDVEFTFLAPFDDAAPTVTVSVTSDNFLLFEFSEEVSGFTTANLVEVLSIEDDEGDSVSVTSIVEDVIEDETSTTIGSDDFEDEEADDTIYLVSLDTPAVDEVEYTFTVDGTVDGKEIKDGSVLANEVAETEFTLTLNDLKDPEVDSEALVVDATTDKQIVRIAFSEAMDEDTLEDINNYMYGASATTLLPLKQVSDVEITVGDDAESVDIYIPKEVLDGMFIMFLGLEDAAGNTIAGTALTAYEIDANATSFADVTFKLTAVDTIEMKSASNTFVEVNEDNFVLYEGGVTSTSFYITNAVIDGKKITLTLSDDLEADVTTDNATVFTIAVTDDDTINTFEVPLQTAALTIADGVSATASIVDDEDDMITVKFDEALSLANGLVTDTNASDIVVRDEDGDVVTDLIVTATTPAGDVTSLVITTAAAGTFDLDSSTTFTVEINGRYLTDGTNIVNDLAETTVTVK